MPNKRFQDMLDEGERHRSLFEKLKTSPMGPKEAAAFLTAVHTRAAPDSPRGFIIDWSTPDFTKIDGDVYWEAWRVLREFGEDSDSGKG